MLSAIASGVALGYRWPSAGVALKPFGDGFIALIEMLIAPVIFLTVVLGIASGTHAKQVGRVALKSLVYFEIVSTFSLVIGLVVVDVFKPGMGFNANPATLTREPCPSMRNWPKSSLLSISYCHYSQDVRRCLYEWWGPTPGIGIGDSHRFGADVHGGSRTTPRAQPVLRVFEALSKAFFKMIGMVMKLAPIGAGSAMAFTVGKYGVHSLEPMFKLMGSFYLTCA